MVTIVIVVILSIGLAGVFSGLETGNYTLNRVRLRFHLMEGDREAMLLERNLKDPKVFIFTTLIGHNLFVYIASSIVTGQYANSGLVAKKMILLYNFFPWSAEVAATFTLMLPLFIFAEVGPKNLFLSYSDSLMRHLARIQWLLILICAPITYPLKWFAKSLTRGGKDFSDELRTITIHKLRFFLSESRMGGVISSRQNAMINNALTIESENVTSLSKALDAFPSLPETADAARCLDMFRKTNQNQIPLYRGKPENVIGVVRFFDVIDALDKGKSVRDNVLEIPRIKTSENLQRAFYRLRENERSLGAIVDADDRVVGFIRLKDIVKRIAGY